MLVGCEGILLGTVVATMVDAAADVDGGRRGGQGGAIDMMVVDDDDARHASATPKRRLLCFLSRGKCDVWSIAARGSGAGTRIYTEYLYLWRMAAGVVQMGRLRSVLHTAGRSVCSDNGG